MSEDSCDAFLSLVMVPGADGGVDKASKEEEKADKQYDTGHATVKSMSFTHTGCLTHKRFLEVYPKMGDGVLRHRNEVGSIDADVKVPQ